MDRKELDTILSSVKEIPFCQTDSFYRDALKSIDEAFEKKPFRIAMVGEFSTGKSTFINALLGRDLLLHATEEVTAAITNIHNVSKSDKKWHSCDVSYNNGSVEHLEDDSKLLDYTTTKSQITNVVNSIKSVDYYTDFMTPNADVVIVDTPGLNGMADGHRELTLSEVKKSDFCIYLVGIRGLAETDKIILKEMSYYQKNFVFVINFIDQIKTSEGETVEEKIDEIREFLSDDVFNEAAINYEVFGVSALKGLAGKDRSIKRLYQGDTSDIEEKDRVRLYDESKIGEVEEYIKQHINTSTIDRLAIERVQHMLANLIDSAIEELTDRKECIDYLRGNDSDNKKLQVLEERLQFFIESSKKNKEKVINFAESECSSIRREFMDYLRNSLEEMRSKFVSKLWEFERYETLEEYIKSNSLDAEVKVNADKIYDYVEDNMLRCLNDILNNILIRIQEYLKGSQIDNSSQTIDFEIKKGIKRTDAEILAAESALNETRKLESEARERFALASETLSKEESEIKVAEERFISTRSSLELAQSEKEKRISNLGMRPELEEKTTYTTETYYVDEPRRGLGKIVDWIFGTKTVKKTRSVPHKTMDDSKRKAWIKQRDQILASCNPEIEKLQSDLDANKNRISTAEKMLKKAKMDEQHAEEDLIFYKQKYEEDKRTLENLKHKANQELLNSLRNSLIAQIERYCDYNEGGIASVIKEYVENTIEENRAIIREKTAEFFEARLEQLVGTYQAEIDGKTDINNQKYTNYENDIEKLACIRKELNDAE